MAILGQSAKLNVRQSVFCCLIAKLNVRQMYHAYGISQYEGIIIQWYCSYHPALSFDVWLHWNRILYYHVATWIN